MKIIKKIFTLLVQRFYSQRLVRTPEEMSEITNNEFIREFVKEGEGGSLKILYKYIVESTSRMLTSNCKALDIGCGPATLLSQIAKNNPETAFTAIDASPIILEKALEYVKKNSIANIDFVERSWFDLEKFEGSSFDLVTWNLALHHCEKKDDALKVLNGIERILKKDGVLFILDTLRPKREFLVSTMVDAFVDNKNKTYVENVKDSFRAGFTFDELEEVFRESKIDNYSHFEPCFMNFWQVVIVGREVPKLNYSPIWQVEYNLFKLFMKYPSQERIHRCSLNCR